MLRPTQPRGNRRRPRHVRWDDLPFELDPLLRVLQSPGTASELRALPRYVELSRRPHPSGAWHAVMQRGAVAGMALLLTSFSGGAMVTAAYTASLPEPVQRVAHHVLGGIGVPRPRPHHGSEPATVPLHDRDQGTNAYPHPAVHRHAHRPLSPKDAHPKPSRAAPRAATAIPTPTPTPRPTLSSRPTARPTPRPSGATTGSPRPHRK